VLRFAFGLLRAPFGAVSVYRPRPVTHVLLDEIEESLLGKANVRLKLNSVKNSKLPIPINCFLDEERRLFCLG
jgi:hypothetical protein